MFTSLKYLESRKLIRDHATTNTSRLSWVDHARGIAIVMVVYRHSVIGLNRAGITTSTWMYNLQELFYNFRMPVFFVLSGIFLAKSLIKKPVKSVLIDRMATILYPYLLWATILILMQMAFSQFANSKRHWSDLIYIIIQPREVDHLWYLFALFNTGMLYLILRVLIPNKYVHSALAIALHIVSLTPICEGNSFFGDLFYYYCFLYAGTLISAIALDPVRREKLLKPETLYWLLPLFIVGQWYWFTHRDGKLDTALPLLIINLVACYFIYVISYSISHYRQLDWLALLGRNSLYIYILHVFVTASVRNVFMHMYSNINPGILLTICWILGLLIPVIVYSLLKPFGFGMLFSLKRTDS